MREEGLGQILGAQAPRLGREREWLQNQVWGLRGTLASQHKPHPPPSVPVPAQVQRGGENMMETGPPTHVGEPPCSSPAGDKSIIVRPTDTLLSN